MSLDFKLILDEFNRRFDELETRWDRRFSPSAYLDLPPTPLSVNHSSVASASAPPTPAAAVGAVVIADNWGGCFDDGEQYCAAPSVVADHWDSPSTDPTHCSTRTRPSRRSRGNREVQRLADLEAQRRRNAEVQVQISLTLAASLAYICLRALLHRTGGLRRLLYLDSLRRDSGDVQAGYATQLARSSRALAGFVLPCALAEAAYKAYWYRAVAAAAAYRFPWWWAAAACAVEVASWVYRVALFFMVCVLFRVICAVACLSLAVKLEEHHAPRLSEFPLDACEFAFDRVSVLRMELLILGILK